MLNVWANTRGVGEEGGLLAFQKCLGLYLAETLRRKVLGVYKKITGLFGGLIYGGLIFGILRYSYSIHAEGPEQSANLFRKVLLYFILLAVNSTLSLLIFMHPNMYNLNYKLVINNIFFPEFLQQLQYNKIFPISSYVQISIIHSFVPTLIYHFVCFFIQQL